MYQHIKGSYADIDAGRQMADVVDSIDEAFKTKY